MLRVKRQLTEIPNFSASLTKLIRYNETVKDLILGSGFGDFTFTIWWDIRRDVRENLRNSG